MRPLPDALSLLATAPLAAAVVALAACDGASDVNGAAPHPARRNVEVVRLSPMHPRKATEPEAAVPALTRDVQLTEPLIETLIEMTRLRHSDAGVGPGEGLQRELSQLTELRLLARVLHIDALRMASIGNPDAAASRVVGIIHVSALTARGDLLVTKLVALANLQLATDTILELHAQGMLTHSGRSTIATSLGELVADDPFHVKAAVADEFELITALLRDNLIGSAVTGGPVPAGQRALTAAELECLGQAFLEAWDGADPIADLERLEASTDDDLARRLMPGVAGFRVQYERARVAVIAALAELNDNQDRMAG